MAVYKKNRRAYSIGQPFADVFNAPIVSRRAPNTKDQAEIGTCWIDTPNDDVYFLTSIVAGSSTWMNSGGGTGIFDSLTVTNAATIGTNLTITAGDLTVPSLAQANATVLFVDNTGKFAANANADVAGRLIIGGSTGPLWSTLTAGGGINIVNADNVITISSPGVTGTTMTADDANVVSPDGAGNTDVIGYDLNITTDGATANTLKVRLADDIVSVASLTATNDLYMLTGTCTITSDDNAAHAIYLHTDAGVNETITIHAAQGTATSSVLVTSDAGGVELSSGLASADSISILASNAAGGIQLSSGTGGINIDALNGLVDIESGTGNIDIGTDAAANAISIGNNTGASSVSISTGTGNFSASSGGTVDINSVGVLDLNSSGGIINIGNDAIAQNINIGTGAAARTISIGNSTGASAVDLLAGTGNVSVNSDLEFGTAAKGIIFQAGPKIVSGAGSPDTAITAPKGSLYLRTDGTTTNDRAYINTDGITGWSALTTAA